MNLPTLSARCDHPPRRLARERWGLGGCLVGTAAWILIAPAPGRAQSPDNPSPAPASAPSQRSVLHGTVVNGASGDPLPHALVRVIGEEGAGGALTDGQGRYEIALAAGQHQVDVLKPGYLDGSAGVAAAGLANQIREYAHTVVVAPSMPDVIFRMTPANSIRGTVRLSTGEPGRIGVSLLKQVVEDGRAAWRVAGQGQSNDDGVYRFGSLGNGTYAICTAPAMESDPASNLIEPGRASHVDRNGYPSVYYPDAREFSGAARIELRGGTNAEADLSLTLEPFRAVTVVPVPPGGRSDPGAQGSAGMIYAATVTDRAGHHLLYPALYDQGTGTVQAFLPQGLYLFLVSGNPVRRLGFAGGFAFTDRSAGAEERLAGEVEVAVAEHAISNLPVPLAATRGSPVEVNLTRTAPAPSPAAGEDQRGVSILLSPTGDWIADGMTVDYAEGSPRGALATRNAEPGTYWAHLSLADPHLCVGSFLAGGAELGREPLNLGIAGPAAPLTLNLRDDCARLTLTLPVRAAGSGLGEEPSYTVFAVPDADSTAIVVPQTLRPSTGGKVTLEGLTPGPYHVYTFAQPVTLAFHDRAALDALPHAGQSVNLAPGSAENLLLEIPEEP